jgi:hypothetical protein
MGKTVIEKRSAGAPPSGAINGADASLPGVTPQVPAAGEPAEPLERARLLAEVARQRVRIAKEELKRARKRVKEAKREARRARKQAAVARKAWKKARKAHRANPAPESAAGKRPPKTKGSVRQGKGQNKGRSKRFNKGQNKSKSPRRRRAARKGPEGPPDSGPVTQSSET